MNCSPENLMNAASCFRCLAGKSRMAVITSSIFAWAFGSGCVNNPALMVPSITGTYNGGTITHVNVTLPKVACDPVEVQIFQADDPTGTNPVLRALIPIDASHAGELNYVLPPQNVQLVLWTAPYIVTKQRGSTTSSAFSNAITVAE